MAYSMFRQSSSPRPALRLIRALTSADALVRMPRSTWQLAPRRTALDRATTDSPFLRATGAMLKQAVVRPATPPYARVSAQLQSLLESVLAQRLEPHVASTRTAEMISAITGSPLA